MGQDKKTVLVVDDMPTILEQARQVAGEKYHIVTAGTGVEMINKLKEIRPDVILLDIYMPDMDGFECLKEIRANSDLAGIPVIIMSTDTSIVTEAKGFTQGASDFLRKPLTKEIMFKRLDMQLELAEYKRMKKRESTEGNYV